MEPENKNFHIPQITLDIKLQKNIILFNKYFEFPFSEPINFLHYI